MLKSAEGVPQGDPAAILAFCIATRDTIETIHSERIDFMSKLDSNRVVEVITTAYADDLE